MYNLYKRVAMLCVALSLTMVINGVLFAAADTHLSGHIIDAETKEHIPFATVLVKGTTLGCISDDSGHFILSNLPGGNYVIAASYVGYKTTETTVEIKNGQSKEVSLVLAPQTLSINEVVVSGSRNETNKRETASIVNVLAGPVFETTAAACVADALNFQSGLRVEYSCQNCGVPQLRINGLEGQYSQILLDSRPIFSSLANVYGLEQLPTGMVERIEVVRGGGSALFGSNAIGGVVNIITKEPLNNSFTVSNQSLFYERGGYDINTTLNGALISSDKNAGVYMYATSKQRSIYDHDHDGFSEIPLAEGETLGFRGYYKCSPFSKITADYHHIREYRRGGNKLDLPPHEADVAEQLRHNINGGGLKYDFFSKDYKHRFNLYANAQYISRDSYFGTNQNLDAYGTTKDLTLVAGGQYVVSFDKLWFMPAEMTAGVEYSDNHLRDVMLGYDRVIEQRSITYGAYYQNEWKNKQWSILLGARLDKHNKVKNPIVSPRVNLRYTPIEEIGLRASYASGYRAPQAYEEDLHVAAVGGEVSIIELDPNLRPEYSHSLSLSADFYKSFGRVETNVLVEGFYTMLNDVFALRQNGHDANGNLLLQRYNAAGATVAGVNVEAKVGFTSALVLDGGFTYQQSRYKEPEQWSDNPNLTPQRRMFRTPDTYGYLRLNYVPFKGFTTSFSGTYTGSMLVQHNAGYIEEDAETITKPFFDMGLRVAYDLKLGKNMGMEFSAGVKNILNAYQPDIDKGVDRDAGYIYGPSTPRSYYGGVKFYF